jgi:CheY-like chemotaxis protein
VLNLTRCSISRVKTGLDAIEACRSTPKPDLVLLDIQLPDMNGEKAAAEIRKSEPYIPIIAQTASQINHEKEQILESGFNELIMKPFAVEELIDLIEKYIM